MNNDLSYSNISRYVTFSSNIKSIEAFCSGGVVLILVIVKEKLSDNLFYANITNDKYKPITTVNGVYNSLSSSRDKDKNIGGRIDPNGQIAIWISSPLDYNESWSFCYPMKR